MARSRKIVTAAVQGEVIMEQDREAALIKEEAGPAEEQFVPCTFSL